ncbi:hypothetical protein SDC9_130433 [bioreactor metagenome]|uniref:Uncharacterized protein n=1 Tax=bioreactor metagenome TaxID=1076179 RepID=A0A645D2D7_9ZZZZ
MKDGGDDQLLDHVHHGQGLDMQGLAVVFQMDLVAGVNLPLGEHAVSAEGSDVFFADVTGECLRGAAVVG